MRMILNKQNRNYEIQFYVDQDYAEFGNYRMGGPKYQGIKVFKICVLERSSKGRLGL